MSAILIKAVEYPSEEVLELSSLTELGLQMLLSGIEDFKREIEDEIRVKSNG